MKALITLLFCAPFLSISSTILRKENGVKYELCINTKVEHWGQGHSKTDLFLAYLQSNQYQTIHYQNICEKARLTPLGNHGDSCLFYDIKLGRKFHDGKKVEFCQSFVVEGFDVSIDFSVIDTIYNYETCDPNVEQFLGSNKPFIDVEQPQLFKISQAIMNESSDVLDYAERCYLFVASRFQYGEPESGFKSIYYTLANLKGDCGNLSSVFITLLRMQGIPARHLMGFRPDGSLHVWADFYLQNYGWIPVDVTYKHDYPTGDYFGNIKFEHNGFIVQRGIAHQINVLESPKRITGLQTYTYQVAYTKAHHAKVYIDRKVDCVPLAN